MDLRILAHWALLGISLVVFLANYTLAQTYSRSDRQLALLVEPPASAQPRLSRVAAILVEQCLGCHNGENADGGYSMSTPAAMLTSGDSKKRPAALDFAAPEAEQLGEIYRRMLSEHPDERMPKDAEPLDWDTLESLRVWLVHGAPVDGSADAPLESFVPSTISLTPRWGNYPRPQSVSALALDAVSQLLFTSGAQEVLVWDWDGKLQGRIPTRGRFIADIEWNAVSNCICISSGDPGRIGYVESVPWSMEFKSTQESARVLHWVARDIPLDLALNPSGDRLAIGTQDGNVLVTQANSNQVLWRSAAHAAAVTSVDWSGDGKYLASSSRDRMAKSFDADSGEILTSFVDHERTVASVRSLHIGCVTMDEAGMLRVYPGGRSANPRASRGGFSQQTPKMASDRETVIVPVEGALKRFRFRTEQVETKDKDGNEKKRTDFHIEERDILRLEGEDGHSVPLSIAMLTGECEVIAAGLVSGHVLLWRHGESAPIRFLNQPN